MPDGQVGMPAMELVPRYKEEQVFIIEAFIVHSVRESGREGVILGLSGGIDSALVAKLCADAIGPGRVLALALPDGKGGRDLKDARRFANAVGIEFRIVNIGPIASAMEKRVKASEADTVARGNLRARARMTVLYYGANTENRVVMGPATRVRSSLDTTPNSATRGRTSCRSEISTRPRFARWPRTSASRTKSWTRPRPRGFGPDRRTREKSASHTTNWIVFCPGSSFSWSRKRSRRRQPYHLIASGTSRPSLRRASTSARCR